MKIRTWGMLCCLLVLAMGAVARAQVVQEKQLIASNMHFTQDGKKLLATVAQKRKATGKFSPWALVSWDVENGRELSRTALPGEAFLSFLFSPDGRLFYRPPMSAEAAKTALRDTITGQVVCELETSNFQVGPQAFSADGKLLAANGQIAGVLPNPYLAETVSQWDVTKFYDTGTGKQVPLFVRESVSERLSTTLFSQDNRIVVRIGTNIDEAKKFQPWVVVFDRHTGQRLKAFFTGEKVLRGYQLSPNGQYLIGIPYMQTYRTPPRQIPLWDTHTGLLLYSMTLTPGDINYTDLHFSADSSQLHAFSTSLLPQSPSLTPPRSYWKQTWSTINGQELNNQKLPIETIFSWNLRHSSLTTSATSDRFFARVTNGNSIQLYEQESGKLLWETEVGLRF